MAVQVNYDRAPYFGNQPAQSFGGRLLFVTGTIVCDDSYPQGGWELDLSGLFPSPTNELVGIFFLPVEGYRFRYDPETKKMIAETWGEEGIEEVADQSADLDGVTVQFIAWGY